MKFAEILNAAIAENNLRREQLFKDYGRGVSARQFVAEFGTVALDIGRGAGKTQYIHDNAKPWDIVVRRNRHYVHREFDCTVITENDIMDWRLMANHQVFKTIYVDDASYFSRDQLHRILGKLVTHHAQTVILLG